MVLSKSYIVIYIYKNLKNTCIKMFISKTFAEHLPLSYHFNRVMDLSVRLIL